MIIINMVPRLGQVGLRVRLGRFDQLGLWDLSLPKIYQFKINLWGA